MVYLGGTNVISILLLLTINAYFKNGIFHWTLLGKRKLLPYPVVLNPGLTGWQVKGRPLCHLDGLNAYLPTYLPIAFLIDLNLNSLHACSMALKTNVLEIFLQFSPEIKICFNLSWDVIIKIFFLCKLFEARVTKFKFHRIEGTKIPSGGLSEFQ